MYNTPIVLPRNIPIINLIIMFSSFLIRFTVKRIFDLI